MTDNPSAMPTFQVRTDLRYLMGMRVRKLLPVATAFLAGPITVIILTTDQIPIAYLLLTLLVGLGTMLSLRVSLRAHEVGTLLLEESKKRISYQSGAGSSINRNLGDVRQIIERSRQGLCISFFDRGDQLQISMNSPRYGEIRSVFSNVLPVRTEKSSKPLHWILTGAVVAITFEYLVFPGNFLHGVVAVISGMGLGFEMLSLEAPQSIWSQGRGESRIELSAILFLLFYSWFVVIVGR